MARRTEKEKPDVHAEITNRIISLLEQGVKPWKRSWKSNGIDCGMPGNPFTGRNYSGVNVLNLWAIAHGKGYQSQSWATYKQIHEAGGQVRKGEQGSHVILFKPMVFTKKNDAGEEETHSFPIMRTFTVFNMEQCDGVTIPKRKEIPEVARLAGAEKYLANIGATVIHGGNQPTFSPSRDVISLPQPGQFKNVESYYAVSLHEHVHWTGHKERLNRIEKRARFGADAYAFEELCAELGSAFVCAGLQLESDIENHASYMESWLKVLRADKTAIFKAAAEASKAHRYLEELQSETSEEIAA